MVLHITNTCWTFIFFSFRINVARVLALLHKNDQLYSHSSSVAGRVDDGRVCMCILFLIYCDISNLFWCLILLYCLSIHVVHTFSFKIKYHHCFIHVFILLLNADVFFFFILTKMGSFKRMLILSEINPILWNVCNTSSH